MTHLRIRILFVYPIRIKLEINGEITTNENILSNLPNNTNLIPL
jgi:hypothetical protein